MTGRCDEHGVHLNTAGVCPCCRADQLATPGPRDPDLRERQAGEHHDRD